MRTGEGPEAALRRSISPKIISEAGHFLQNPRCFPPGRKDPPAAPALWHSAEFRPGLQARWASGPKADQLPGHVRSFYLASIFTQASPTISHSPLRPKRTCWGPEAAAELLLPGSEKTFPWPASLQKEETCMMLVNAAYPRQRHYRRVGPGQSWWRDRPACPKAQAGSLVSTRQMAAHLPRDSQSVPRTAPNVTGGKLTPAEKHWNEVYAV